MKRLLLWFVDRPVVATGLLVALTAGLAAQIPRLEIDTSAAGFMVEKDPARRFYEEVKQKFGSDTLTIVAVKADDVFTAPVLGVVKRISDAVRQLPGVARVDSLTTVKNLAGRGDTLDTEPLVGVTVPTDPAALARIRAEALDNRVFVGNIVARDGRATAIVVFTDPDGKGFHERFTGQVEALIQREQGAAPGLTIYQTGDSFLKVTYADYIRLDQRTVLPIGAAILFASLLVAFRSLQGVVIPLTTAGLSIVWTFGLMAAAGLPLNAMTGIVPALLIAIGFAEDVHMLCVYRLLIEQGQDKPTALRDMVADTALPLLVTSATTVFGFLSLITSDVTGLIQFGYAAAVGLTANYVVTNLALPVMLRLWPVSRVSRPPAFEPGSDRGTIPWAMERLGAFNVRYRLYIAIVAACLVLVSLVGWTRLRVDNDFMSFFPPDSPVRRRAEDLHRSLSGAVAFYVVVDTGREDGVKDPDLLRRIAVFQDALAGTGRIDKTVSVADYVRKMRREINRGDPAFETVPDTPEEVAQYLLILEGPELAKYVDFNASAANILVRHNLTSSWNLSALRREVEAHAARIFPATIPVRVTGETILINNAADYMSVNEITGLATALLIIGIIHSFLFTSIKAGFLSLVPNLIPILYAYGLMGLVGIPLNTATATVATVALGIAVDDTVHHMVTYSRQLNEHHDQKVAMLNTMRAQGRPIIYVSLALAANFFALGFSQFVPTVHVGLVSGIVMLIAMAGELTLTPILMYSTRLVTLWDLLLVKMHPELVRSAPLFRGLSRWEARKVVLLGRLQALAAGEYAVRKGDPGAEMYMIVTGRLRVFDLDRDGREGTLALLGPGAVFGEMALVERGVRSANVIAETPAELLRLDFEALERIRKRFPYTSAKLFRNLAAVLSVRLRHAEEAMLEAAIRGRAPRDLIRY